jgi:HD-GYP domain-containing protein (c-di-GMP phosphodiesterase class II)
MRRKNRKTEQAAERLAAATLETLLRAVDANDDNTGAHVRRVAVYSRLIGRFMGLDEEAKLHIERVALFHDIGKIHEALFDVIHDKAHLTVSSRRAVLSHPDLGARVLSPLDAFYPDLSKGVIAHHERWNGSGYPRGLKGKKIPLSARIVAIADTFDAITRSRRYSKARSTAAATEVILKGRGVLFDPELVDLFVFPPVYHYMLQAKRLLDDWKEPLMHRRESKRPDKDVPEVSFRWRPEQHAAIWRRMSGR